MIKGAEPVKKALFVASIASFIDGFESNDTKILQEMGYTVEAACNAELSVGSQAKALESLAVKKIGYHPISFARSPFSKQTLEAYCQLKKLMTENNYDIIHCHTPVAGILARLVARKARKQGTKVIYTAHGFHFYKGASLLNWLLYYPAEKICSYFTDVLITINQEDYALAQRKMKAKKIYYIPGVGIDTGKFAKVEIDKNEKRKSLGLLEDDVVLLSVGELNTNKNHATVIRALGKIKEANIHYVIAGIGDQKDTLEQLAREEGVNLHLLGYRNDVAELYKMADMFVFPSYREGLSVSLMEAMGSGLPCVASNIRGNTDLVQAGQGGYLISPDDVEGVRQAILTLSQEEELRKRFGLFNQSYVNKFDIQRVGTYMKEIYQTLT